MFDRLQTIGYHEAGAQARIDAFLTQGRAVLVDIRERPWSQWPAFKAATLVEKYGAQYVQVADLGNVNYRRPEYGIKLAYPELGSRRVVEMIKGGSVVLLLCGCAKYATCHRKVAFELILADLIVDEVVGVPVVKEVVEEILGHQEFCETRSYHMHEPGVPEAAVRIETLSAALAQANVSMYIDQDTPGAFWEVRFDNRPWLVLDPKSREWNIDLADGEPDWSDPANREAWADWANSNS